MICLYLQIHASLPSSENLTEALKAVSQNELKCQQYMVMECSSAIPSKARGTLKKKGQKERKSQRTREWAGERAPGHDRTIAPEDFYRGGSILA